MAEAEGRELKISSVYEWRNALLVEAGYPQEEAMLLAERVDVDVHVAVDLLANGCGLALALRILL